MTARWLRCAVCVGVLLLLASRARAGFELPLDGAAARDYSGGCSATGTYANKTVPRCTGTADGEFKLYYTVHTAGAAPTCTMLKTDITTVGDPSDTTSAACFTYFCTAVVKGSNPHTTITYNAGATLTYDMDADGCITPDKDCVSSTAGAVNIRNLNAGADCTGTLCQDAGLVIRVRYNGTAGTGCTNGFTGGLDWNWGLLSVSP
jgi:hypothetical protein